jgi:hypothetical protein
MVKVNINGSEFDTDNMSDEAKNQLVMLQFTDAEIRRLEGQLAVYRTAKIAYSKALVEACEFRFNPAGDSDLIPATIPI